MKREFASEARSEPEANGDGWGRLCRTGTRELILGAVAYEPKVVTIWDGFARYLASRGLPFDYVLYTSYERQVEAHFAGHIDVAWNSPLAWLEAAAIAERVGRRAEAICMRDTDRDLRSVFLVRKDAPLAALGDLRGKTVAVGAADSPQATLIPLAALADAGVEPYRDCAVLPFDVLLGKHGDHIGGERDAVRALLDGRADAACVLDANHLAFAREGTIPAGAVRVLGQTERYDHCNFTVLDGGPASIARFSSLLLEMSYDDPELRPLLDLEGLKRWVPGRVEGYAPLDAAVRRFGTIAPFVERVAARCR